ncbi:hypothetical protein Defa_02680 [Desulfovibrio sp. TH_2024_36128]|uniref:Transposase n=1 Tax=Desulfovibrio falkowii TaxID=3136602 RepID=A0ABQ0E4Y9_9BACT
MPGLERLTCGAASWLREKARGVGGISGGKRIRFLAAGIVHVLQYRGDS